MKSLGRVRSSVLRTALISWSALPMLIGCAASEDGVDSSATSGGSSSGGGGSSATGGQSGSAPSAGGPAGAASGGVASGGEPSGGVASGGESNGGSASGGASNGGSAGGGASSGTSASGGFVSGGSAGMSAGGSAGTSAGGSAGTSAGGSAGAGSVVDQNSLPASTLWLVGDSTVAENTSGTAQTGWGQELPQFFITKLKIVNRAIGGRSVQSFMYSDTASTMESPSWTDVKSQLKAGDFVTVQFGANDSSGIEGRAVTPANFEMLLGRMVEAVKAKGATPILVTPSALQIWVNGKETNTRLAPYAAAMISLGPKQNILVADLNARSVAYVDGLGQTAAQQVYFEGDKAHFTKYGAMQFARMVTEELTRIGTPLAAYLKP